MRWNRCFTGLESLGIILVTLGLARAGTVIINPDGKGDTYGQFQTFGFGTEVPDCKHAVKHMGETYDAQLGKNVFVFSLHRDLDDDRCINTDRQRVELRSSGAALQGLQNTYTIHRWKFKIDAGFQGSGNFCHIMQIKGYGNGHGSGAPIITLTLRVNTVEINHGGALKSTDMAPFKGQWVEAYMKVLHADKGSVDMILKRVSDGQVLMSYSNANLDMWDNGAGYGGFKCGMYRSLNNKNLIRDENILLSDITITQGETEAVPSALLGPAIGAGNAGSDGANSLSPYSLSPYAIHRSAEGRVSFMLPHSGLCRIEVINPSGRQVAALEDIVGLQGENLVPLEGAAPAWGAYLIKVSYLGSR